MDRAGYEENSFVAAISGASRSGHSWFVRFSASVARFLLFAPRSPPAIFSIGNTPHTIHCLMAASTP